MIFNYRLLGLKILFKGLPDQETPTVALIQHQIITISLNLNVNELAHLVVFFF